MTALFKFIYRFEVENFCTKGRYNGKALLGIFDLCVAEVSKSGA